MFRARRILLLVAALAGPALALSRAPAPLHPRPTHPSGWPCWRGPDRTGVSRETGLLARWGKDGPRLLWKNAAVGNGYSTPAVAGNRIYLLGGVQGKETLLCLDAANSGKEVWTAVVGDSRGNNPRSYPGPRSTPTVDDNRVYALASGGDLVCLTLAGKEVWRKHLVKDLNGVAGQWGYAESPLIDGDVLICTPGGGKATLAALNKKTGAVVWTAAATKGNQAAYASAIVAEVSGVRQYIQFLGGSLVGVSARDGKVLWSYEGVSGLNNCATPVFHDGHVFVSAWATAGSSKGGSALLELKRDGSGVSAREVYRITTFANHHGGVVYLGGCLYGTSGVSLTCLDFKTGRTKWQNNSVGAGSVLAANGHLYVRGDRGPVALVEASAAGYTEKSRFNPSQGSQTTARPHPVVAYGKLYLRDQNVLLCYDLKQE